MAPAVFQILIALADQPLHGYGIMLDIAERSDGKVKLSPGTLYGSIKQMLEGGLDRGSRPVAPRSTTSAGGTTV